MTLFSHLKQLLGPPLPAPVEVYPPLPLTVPTCAQRKSGAIGNATQLTAELQANRAQPGAVLSTLAVHFNRFNQEIMPVGLRLELLQAALPFAIPALNQCYTNYMTARATGQPPLRSPGLGQALAAIQVLVTAHQHVLLADYAASAQAFCKVADRATMCAVRILELLRIEQRLLALDHQKLPAIDWIISSQIFFALQVRGDGQRQWPKLAQGAAIDDGAFGVELTPTVSLSQVYLSLQLFGLFDLMNWPVLQRPILDAYIQPLALAFSPDNQEDLPLGWVILFHGSEYPPSFTRIGRAGREAVLLNLWPLEKRLRLDQTVLAGEVPETELSPSLVQLAADQRQALIDRWLQRLQPIERAEERHILDKPKYLQLATGFMACYDWLQNDGNPIGPKPKTGKWQVVDVSYRGMRLVAEESALTKTLQPGQLVVFRLEGGNHPAFELGHLMRIERTHDQRVEAVILKLAPTVNAVTLSEPTSPATPIPAFLLHARTGEWQIAVQAQQSFQPERCVLNYVEYDRQLTVVLGQPGMTTMEFKLLDLCVC